MYMILIFRCRDYIEINTGTGGTQEYCGSSLPSDPFIVGTGVINNNYFSQYSLFEAILFIAGAMLLNSL